MDYPNGNAMHLVPEPLSKTVRDIHGEAGEDWLRGLPGLLDKCARRWSLSLGSPFPHVAYNYVAPADRADGGRVVLKVGFPSRELEAEIEAMRLYGGRGIARLIDADAAWGAMLLERVEPGTTLAAALPEIGDERATSIAAGVMRALWRPVPLDHTFPMIAKWAQGIERQRKRSREGTEPLPTTLVEEAEAVFDELTRRRGEPVLLHGDLHHTNILAATREPWLAIDPMPIVGERAYEVGTFLLNPHTLLPAPDPREVLRRRLHIFAEELDLDRERLRICGVAQAVLSACWSLEDHGEGWEDAIACAEHLVALR